MRGKCVGLEIVLGWKSNKAQEKQSQMLEINNALNMK